MGFLRRPPADGLLDDGRPEVSETITNTILDDLEFLRARLDGLDARLAVVEQHLTSVDHTADAAADQRDVIDAQVRAARVAADMHLVAIELRAEVQRLWGEWPQQADVDGAPAELAESVTDLVERLVDITAGEQPDR
jgi:hypothetical protein